MLVRPGVQRRQHRITRVSGPHGARRQRASGRLHIDGEPGQGVVRGSRRGLGGRDLAVPGLGGTSRDSAGLVLGRSVPDRRNPVVPGGVVDADQRAGPRIQQVFADRDRRLRSRRELHSRAQGDPDRCEGGDTRVELVNLLDHPGRSLVRGCVAVVCAAYCCFQRCQLACRGTLLGVRGRGQVLKPAR